MLDRSDAKVWPIYDYKKLDTWQEFSADGFDIPVGGCVYDGKNLRSGLPLGGLGTGYLDLEPNGKIGEYSIYNNHVPPLNWNRDWLQVECGNVEEPLSSAELEIWGHFPVADIRGRFPVVPADVAIRAFFPFIPGDEACSNTPAAAFEIRITNNSCEARNFMIKLQFPEPDKDKNKKDPSDYMLLADDPGTVMSGKASARLNTDIPAGGTYAVRVVFAWYAPRWRASTNEVLVNYYHDRFASAGEIARHMMEGYDKLLKRVLSWQKVIYAQKNPVWFNDMLVQCFYSFAKNSVWIAKTHKDEWWSGEKGWFMHNESFRGCPIVETMVCRMHGHFPILFFFPELEETALHAFRYFQIEGGEVPHCFGLYTSTLDVRHHCQHPINSGYYTQMVLQYYDRTGDARMLQEYYPSLKRAVRYHYRLDDDGDGLVNDHAHAVPGEGWPANQFYDIWPWRGTSAYVAGIWLATLKAAARAAGIMDDADFRKECEAAFEKGRAAYDEKLWTGHHYRLWNDTENGEFSDDSLGNQLMAEWCAAITGTGPVLDGEKANAALDTVWNTNVAVTQFGMASGVTPDGERCHAVEHEMLRVGGTHETFVNPYGENNDLSTNVVVAESMASAMTFLWKGRREQGIEIIRRIYDTIALHSRTPWDQHCHYSSYSGQPVWGGDYYSNMIEWLAPLALESKSIAEYFADMGNLVNKVIDAGR